MSTAQQVLAATTSVLLIDWPTRDIPDPLARAGFTVVSKGGPEPDNYPSDTGAKDPKAAGYLKPTRNVPAPRSKPQACASVEAPYLADAVRDGR